VLLQRSSEGGRDLWTCSRNEIFSGVWRGHLRSAGLNKYTRRNHVSQKVCNCIRMWHKGPSLYPIPSRINLLHIPQIHWNNICWKAQVKKLCSLFHCYFVSSISVPNILKIIWSLLIYGQIGDASVYQTSNDGVAATMNWMNVEESGLRMWDNWMKPQNISPEMTVYVLGFETRTFRIKSSIANRTNVTFFKLIWSYLSLRSSVTERNEIFSIKFLFVNINIVQSEAFTYFLTFKFVTWKEITNPT
jgi:hypothetical protein